MPSALGGELHSGECSELWGKENAVMQCVALWGDNMSCGFDIVYVEQNLELCSCFWMNDLQFAEV